MSNYRKALQQTWNEVVARWRPPPKLTVSEWADKYAYLSPESSAQPGKWKTLPYQRGMMDVVNKTGVHRISIKKSARVGYTKMLNHIFGYHTHQDPCPIMGVQPTIDDAEGYSKEEIAPMLRDTPVLRGLVADSKSRDSDNTILKKAFPGGRLLLVGANAARGFRRVSVRKVLFDEVDGYPATAGNEGDQIQLGTKRTEWYWNWQVILGSTPTVKGLSRIEDSYDSSDRRRRYLPCPFCNTMQTLEWKNLDWSEKGTRANPVFVCVECDKGIPYKHHRGMDARGEWRAEAEFTCCGEEQTPEAWDETGGALCKHCGRAPASHAGFFIWAAYSYAPNAVWRRMVDEFYAVKDDPDKLRTFVNTVLGETWEDEGDALDHTILYNRREQYRHEVPLGAGILIAGADTQDDRLECSVWAYGAAGESWLVCHEVFYGDPAKQLVWDKLEGMLSRRFEHESGRGMYIHAMGVDTAGHHTTMAYKFCKPLWSRRVYALIGRDGQGRPLASRPTRGNAAKVRLFTVGADTAKELLYGRLRITERGPGYVHFPLDQPSVDEKYFMQLTSEKVITTYKKGRPVRVWINPGKKRNEALDCRVYADGALEISRPNLQRLVDEYSTRVDDDPDDTDDDDNAVPAEPAAKPVEKKQPFVGSATTTKRKGGFTNSW